MPRYPLSVFIVLLLIFFAAEAQSPLQNAGANSQDGCIAVIDVHTHTAFKRNSERTSNSPTEDQYFKEWREAGVVGAIAHTSASGEDFFELKNRNVIYCGGVGDSIDLKRIEDGLKSRNYRCIKVYLGYTYRYAYDPLYEPIYRLAQKYDVPVVFHTGDTASTKAKLKFADPLTIDEVAVDHPKVNFVIAHCGNPWIESAAEVAYKNPNVFIECSALLTGNLDQMPKEKVDIYVVRPIAWVFGYLEDPKKMMFGSDWPLVTIKPYVEAYKRAIPKEHWKAVFHDNAVRVFKFSQNVTVKPADDGLAGAPPHQDK
jgi:hypothetical protein